MIDDRCGFRHCRRIVVPHTDYCNADCRRAEGYELLLDGAEAFESDAETRGCQQFHEAQDMELNR